MNEEYPTNPYTKQTNPYSKKQSPYINKTSPYSSKTSPFTPKEKPYGPPGALYPILLQENGNTIRTEDGIMLLL